MNINGTPPKDQGWEVKSRMTFRPTFVCVYKYLQVTIYKYLCSVKMTLVFIVTCDYVHVYKKNDTEGASYYSESIDEGIHLNH